VLGQYAVVVHSSPDSHMRPQSLEDQPALNDQHATRNCGLLTRAIRTSGRIDVRRNVAQCARVGCIGCWLPEVDMIQHVIGLGAHLESYRFSFEDVFKKIHVDIGIMRSVEGVPWHTAEVCLYDYAGTGILWARAVENSRCLEARGGVRGAMMVEIVIDDLGEYGRSAGRI
jgi:hypothetical protein